MKYNFAIFLLKLRDSRGVFLFPSNNEFLPGLYLEDYQKDYLDEDVKKWVVKQAGIADNYLKINFRAILSPDLILDENRIGRLYLLEANGILGFDASICKTLPDILRSLPKSKNRAPYIKSLQVFSGADEQTTDAVEMDEALKNRLKERLDKDDQ